MLEIDRERLSGALRIQRKALKLTMGEAGAKIGCAAATVCRIESGLHDPSSVVLLRTCLWLNRDPRGFSRFVGEFELGTEIPAEDWPRGALLAAAE